MWRAVYFVVIYHIAYVNMAMLQHMEMKAKEISFSTEYFGFV